MCGDYTSISFIYLLHQWLEIEEIHMHFLFYLAVTDFTHTGSDLKVALQLLKIIYIY
jgi:hypothetical protein